MYFKILFWSLVTCSIVSNVIPCIAGDINFEDCIRRKDCIIRAGGVFGPGCMQVLIYNKILKNMKPVDMHNLRILVNEEIELARRHPERFDYARYSRVSNILQSRIAQISCWEIISCSKDNISLILDNSIYCEATIAYHELINMKPKEREKYDNYIINSVFLKKDMHNQDDMKALRNKWGSPCK